MFFFLVNISQQLEKHTSKCVNDSIHSKWYTIHGTNDNSLTVTIYCYCIFQDFLALSHSLTLKVHGHNGRNATHSELTTKFLTQLA